MRFVDTNVFIRFFTRDDPAKGEASHALFKRVQSGHEQVTTSESVISEIVYVLSSSRLYKRSRQEIRAMLLAVLTLKGMRLANRGIYVRALDVFVEHKIDFEDALTVAHIEHESHEALLSYDRDFDRIAGITRQEP